MIYFVKEWIGIKVIAEIHGNFKISEIISQQIYNIAYILIKSRRFNGRILNSTNRMFRIFYFIRQWQVAMTFIRRSYKSFSLLNYQQYFSACQGIANINANTRKIFCLNGSIVSLYAHKDNLKGLCMAEAEEITRSFTDVPFQNTDVRAICSSLFIARTRQDQKAAMVIRNMRHQQLKAPSSWRGWNIFS